VSDTTKELTRVMTHLNCSFLYNSTMEAVEAIRNSIPADNISMLHHHYSDIEETRDSQDWVRYGEAVNRLLGV